MSFDNDLLTFETPKPHAPTGNDLIVRDDEEVLISADRSRNASSEWEIRGYCVYGEGIRFTVDSVDQANLAALFVEVFTADDLTSRDKYRPTGPLREGIPVAVATDGTPAIAAWLRVRGYDRDEIAESLSVGDRTVVEYLSRFRQRGTGIPADVDAPEVGSVLAELPSSMDYSGGEGE